MSRIIFDFLAFCLSEDRAMPKGIEQIDWRALYEFARQQSILGVVFYGMQRLPADKVAVPKDVLMQFLVAANQIRQRNIVMYQRSAQVSEQFLKEGFRNCILKGQGNALMYPDPYVRMSGDIDLWMQGKQEDIVAYAKKYVPDAEVRCYHVEFHVIKDVPIELHFVPVIANNWIYRRRMRKYFEQLQEQQCSNVVVLPDDLGHIPVPTVEFNLVYQLAHIMHHFFDEGIGLRQLMDYFYLMKNEKCRMKNLQFGETNLPDVLEHLGLRKFAGAVMYVLQEVFGLEDEYLIVPVDEWRGKTLLEEILRGGNFGHYSGLTEHGAATKYFLKIRRNMRFVRQYPAEALCEPLFRTWHFFWRLSHS